MSKGESGLFVGIEGSRVTAESISNNREELMGKSLYEVKNILEKHGYETKIKVSKNSMSKAKIIVIGNVGKEKNITQVQVSPGSKRHGNVPYIKISTTDIGKHKVIDAYEWEYKSDGKENTRLLFRRDKNDI